MTPEQFTYWLQGFVELNGTVPTTEQWQSIKEHLTTVFHKVTPPVALPSYTIDINKHVKELMDKEEQQTLPGWPPLIPGVTPRTYPEIYKLDELGNNKIRITC